MEIPKENWQLLRQILADETGEQKKSRLKQRKLRRMWKNHPITEEQQKEAYYLLGFLSTKFSALESAVQELLSRLCGLRLDFSDVLIEEYSLAKKMELIMKVNKFLKWEETRVADLNSKLFRLRQTRNGLIHGIWAFTLSENADVLIMVSSKKSVFKSGNYSGGNREYFTFQEIRNLIDETKDAIDNTNQLSKDCKTFYQQNNYLSIFDKDALESSFPFPKSSEST